jgi:hypothetical protein
MAIFMVAEAVTVKKQLASVKGATLLPWQVHFWRRLHQQVLLGAAGGPLLKKGDPWLERNSNYYSISLYM